MYDQNFYVGGGGGGGRGGRWGVGNSERCLKWSGPVITESLQKHLKMGDGRSQKVFVRGRVLEVASPLSPSSIILIVHL